MRITVRVRVTLTMQTDFENMNMYAVSFSHSATFLIQSIGNVFTKMMFSNSLGGQGTCLSVKPAFAYINTLLRPSVAEHLAHPIAYFRFKSSDEPPIPATETSAYLSRFEPRMITGR